MGDFLRSLGVNLLGQTYFKNNDPVCDEEDYLRVSPTLSF